SYFVAILIGLVLLGVGIWQWLQRPGERERFDQLILRLPGLGGIARKFATSQAARTVATLLGGGIPLVNAIDVSARSIRNQYMARELHAAAQQVREGRALSAAMNDSGALPAVSAPSLRNQYMARELHAAAQQVREGRALSAAMNDSGAFPDVAIKMVEVGESTGALQEMLNSLADFFDEEIETNLGRFVTIIEPALLIIMGIVIAGLLLSLYLPLFKLSSALDP